MNDRLAWRVAGANTIHNVRPSRVSGLASGEIGSVRVAALLWDLYNTTSLDEEECNAELKAGIRECGRLLGTEFAATALWRMNFSVQAAVESLRRCRDAISVLAALSGLEVSVILAGSTAYGRFFSLRQLRELRPSDLDLVIVTQRREEIGSVLARLAEVAFVEFGEADLDSYFSRSIQLLPGYDTVDYMATLRCWEHEPDPISVAWGAPSGYELSIHVCSVEDFKHYILPLSEYASAQSVTIRNRDSRERGRGKLVREYWTWFSGDFIADDVDRRMVSNSVVDIRQPFQIVDGLPYIGRFLRSIMPRFEFLKATNDVVCIVRDCLDQLAAELTRCRGVSDSRCSYECAHPHRLHFAPAVLGRCIDTDRLSAESSELLRRRASDATAGDSLCVV